MALFAVMAMIAALGLISATAFVLTTTEVGMSGYHRRALEAFYNADAGAQYVKTRIENQLASGTLTLANAIESVSYTAPSGYSFDPVTNLVRLSDGSFYFQIVGRAGESQSRLTVSFRRKPLLGFGVFGDSEVDMKANGNVYSYYSSQVPNPTGADSTGEADTGSNQDFITHVGTFIDGSVVLGKDAFGNQALWSDPGSGSTVTGDAGRKSDRVEDDPLGMVGGELAAEFVAVASANDNASAVPAIPNDRDIGLGNGDTMTLRSGSYYVEDMVLKNGATLNIVATNGPVKIYLTGGADFQNDSRVNITGRPTDVSIYVNSSQDVRLFHDGTFRGLVYAPFSMVEVKNDGNFFGLAWADEVDIKNSGDVFIDLDLIKKLLSDTVEMISWKENRP